MRAPSAPTSVRSEGLAIAPSEYDAKVQVQKLLEATQNRSGQSFRIPAQAEVHALDIRMPPGSETGWHQHPYSGFAYVVEGKLEVEVRPGERHVYEAGEAFAEVIGRVHNGRVLGDKPVRLIGFFFSEPGQPFAEKLPANP
jgi:quercetin dioxygenase-like cupin family protein